MKNPWRVRETLEAEFGPCIFPGHPMVIATYALTYYGGFAPALAPDAEDQPQMTRSEAIPGDARMVRSAADLLARIVRGMDHETAIRWANESWAYTVRNEYPDLEAEIPAGQAQATAMRKRFVQLVTRALRANTQV